MHGFVVEKLFEEDVHFQGLELRLAQKGVGVVRAIEIQVFSAQLTVVLANAPAILNIEIAQVGVERKCILNCD